MARAASSIITSRRRSSRSMRTPVKGSITMAGSVCRTANVPSAISEWVFCRMVHATAAEFMPLPSMETTFAANTNRSERSCRMVRMIRI